MTISPPSLWRQPALPHPFLQRVDCLNRLNSAPVACLLAPAGYGKTCVALAWTARQPAPVAWYTLETEDREPRHLEQGLLEALAKCSASLHLGSPRATGDGQALLSYLRDVASGHVYGLVVDDLQRLEGCADGVRLLDTLLRAASPRLRLLLVGRRLPPLPSLPRLALAGQLVHLGPEVLCFSRQEAAAWLEMAGCDVEQAEALYAATRGWPAALRWLAGPGGGHGLPAARFDTYLAAEVMGDLPADLAPFAVAASVLPEWTAEACDWVLERDDSAQVLARLAESGLPLEPGPAGGLLPHPLWRQYLLSQLRQTPAHLRALQRRAALWACEQGDTEGALTHGLATADFGLTEPLLRRLADRLLSEGQLDCLDGWLAATPSHWLDRLPDLSLALGEALRQAGRPRRAQHWLRQAAEGYALARDPAGLLRAFCCLAMASADAGDWSEAEAALAQLEAEWPAAEGPVQGEAWLALARGHLGAGRYREALERFQQAGDLFARLGRSARHRQGLALVGLAQAATACGDTAAALAALHRAETYLPGAAASEAVAEQALLLVALARWEEVRAALARMAAAGYRQEVRWHWLRALALAQDDLAAAQGAFAAGLQLQSQLERTPDLVASELLARGWLALAAGRREEAQVAARQAVQASAEAGHPILHQAASALLARCDESPAAASASLSAGLEVFLLGGFRLRRGDTEVTPAWGRAQVRAIFQFLVLQPGHQAGRESLLESFWPDSPADLSRRVLRVTLHRLRKVLQGLGWDLETSSEAVRLPPGAVAWTDIQALRASLEEARAAIATEPARCLERCQQGRSLYRGELLAEAYWAWADGPRERARRDALELLQLGQAAASRLGRWEEALALLDDLLQLEPGHEEAVRQLLLVLSRLGRRAEAVRRYHDWAAWLRRELGVAPEPATRQVLQQLLS